MSVPTRPARLDPPAWVHPPCEMAAARFEWVRLQNFWQCVYELRGRCGKCEGTNVRTNKGRGNWSCLVIHVSSGQLDKLRRRYPLSDPGGTEKIRCNAKFHFYFEIPRTRETRIGTAKDLNIKEYCRSFCCIACWIGRSYTVLTVHKSQYQIWTPGPSVCARLRAFTLSMGHFTA